MNESKFPNFPFDGQILLDVYGVRWRYNAEQSWWENIGQLENVPIATETASGLLSAYHKRKIDSIPSKGGGFAIITRPLKRAMTANNVDGIIYGDIKLASDSLDITCISPDGNELNSSCVVCSENKGEPPGFNFQLSEKFLNSYCIKVPTIPGAKGDKGDTGPQGDPGTGDGPVGEQGDPGKSYTVAGNFTGIKVLDDVENLYDTAVVNLELSQSDGTLKVLRSKVKTASTKTPANKIICSQIFRSIKFNENDWDFQIETDNNDILEADVNILSLPDNFTSGVTEVSIIKLSAFVNAVINDLREAFDDAVAGYDKQVRALILEKDKDARESLCSLSRELTDCEWSAPYEYCMGIKACAGPPPPPVVIASMPPVDIATVPPIDIATMPPIDIDITIENV